MLMVENKTEKIYNRKLVKAYLNAYSSYKAACDRYNRLVKAYKILDRFKTGKSSDERGPAYVKTVRVPHTENIMKRMLEDARTEKKFIASYAKECIKNLGGLKYEM